jgi:hypothetical protein
MKTITIAISAISGLTAVIVALAPPASAIRSAAGSVADSYTVTLDRVGPASLRPCALTDPIGANRAGAPDQVKHVMLPWTVNVGAAC